MRALLQLMLSTATALSPAARILSPRPPLRLTPRTRTLHSLFEETDHEVDSRPREMQLPLYDVSIVDAPVPFPPVRPASESAEFASDAPLASFRYTFDRAAYLRMLDEVEASDDKCFGYCLDGVSSSAPSDSTPDASPDASPDSLSNLLLREDSLAKPGAVGCAMRLLNVDRGKGGGTSVALIRATPLFRFRIAEVTRSIPYPVARVVPLFDEEITKESESEKRCLELEATIGQSLRALLTISAKVRRRCTTLQPQPVHTHTRILKIFPSIPAQQPPGAHTPDTHNPDTHTHTPPLARNPARNPNRNPTARGEGSAR